jgi:hypothetical protein
MNYREIEKEVQSGLKNSQKRLLDARENLCYYHGDFDEYESNFIPLNRKKDNYSDRKSRLFNRIVNTLSSYVYKTPPARTIKGNPGATDFLQKVYKDNAMFAQWLQADRHSMVNQVAAFRVLGTENPESPIDISLFDSSQFDVFCDPDDPTKVIAHVQIDHYDNQRRLILWTPETITTFLTEKWSSFYTSGKTAPVRQSKVDNPYGFIPFSYVHFNYPTTDFWSGGPGDNLKCVNRYVNWRLTKSADAIRYLGNPILAIEGVTEWNPPADLQPGDFLPVPPRKGDPMENPTNPSVKLIEPDTGFVQAGIDDIEFYINHTLEMHGIPEAAIRMVQSVARSGTSIQSEQLPLIQWAKGRQPQFAHYESCLAKLVFQVATAHLRTNGIPNKELEAALKDFELTVRFAELWHDIPGEERDRADDWLLSHSLTSRTQVLMKRNNLTREEAIAELKAIADDLKDEEGLGLPDLPTIMTNVQEPKPEATNTQESEL